MAGTRAYALCQAAKHLKYGELKEEIDKPTVTSGDFHAVLVTADRIEQKISSDAEKVNRTSVPEEKEFLST